MLNNRQDVINTLKTGMFPYIDGFQIKEKSEEESEKKKKKELTNFFNTLRKNQKA